MALTLTSNSPAANAIDVVLQSAVTLNFNQAVNRRYITADTFVMFSAGSTVFKEAGGALPFDRTKRNSYADTDYVEGTFSFENADSTVVFTPTKPLKPNTVYTVMVGGYDVGAATTKYVRAAGNTDRLETTVRWTFTTGILDVADPPDKVEEIDYDTLIEDIIESQGALASEVLIHPSNNSYNVSLVDDVLFTITFPEDVDTTSLDYTVFLVDMNDPLARQLEVPTTYGLEGTKIVKIRLA